MVLYHGYRKQYFYHLEVKLIFTLITEDPGHEVSMKKFPLKIVSQAKTFQKIPKLT